MIIYQLKIYLQSTCPEVWRKVHLSPDTTLLELHKIIQALMCWEDFQKHTFTHQSKTLAESTTIIQTFTSTEKIQYSYGLSSPWHLDIQLEQTLTDQEKDLPTCIAGEGAGPLEDCEGSAGYIELLEILKDKNNLRHTAVRAWAGEHFDPWHFDLQITNSRLSRLQEEI